LYIYYQKKKKKNKKPKKEKVKDDFFNPSPPLPFSTLFPPPPHYPHGEGRGKRWKKEICSLGLDKSSLTFSFFGFLLVFFFFGYI